MAQNQNGVVIRPIIIRANLTKIVVAAGAGNLFSDPVVRIVEGLAEIYRTLKRKFQNASIWVQAIAPKPFTTVKMAAKIREINEALRGKFLCDPFRNFVTNRGKMNRELFRKDGLYPSEKGNEMIMSALERLAPIESPTSQCNSGNNANMSIGPRNEDDSQWSIKYDREEIDIFLILSLGFFGLKVTHVFFVVDISFSLLNIL